MPARKLLAVLATGLIAFAGCGDDDPSAPSPPSGSAAGPKASGSSVEPDGTTRKLRAEARDVLEDSLRGLASRSGPDDDTYFESGIWHGGESACAACNVAPGMIAAVLARGDGPRSARTKAIATFDRLIAEETQDDGSFSPPREGFRGSELPTVKAGLPFAVAYLELEDSLPARTRRRWQVSLRRAGRWMLQNIDFYVNGNVNLGMTAFVYLAWRATGDKDLKSGYEQSLDFTLNPGKGRFAKYGLRFTKRPRRDDWSDGRGYLAEANGNEEPGFDPYYLTVQESNAAILHAVAGTRATRRLLNVLSNTTRARSSSRTWTYPISGGSRRGREGERIPLLTPGMATLALGGDRPNLAGRARAQLRTVVEPNFRGAVLQGNRQEGVIAGYAAALVAAHRDELPESPG